MESRLSDSSISSDETSENYNSSKRKFDYSLNDSSDELASKVRRFDSSGDDNVYCNKESEDEEREQVDGFEAPRVQSFYDRNDSDDKSNDENEDKSSASYFHKNNFSDNEQESPVQSSSSKSSKSNLDTSQTSEKSKIEGFGERYLKMWGFKEGKGLGKGLQGRAKPVEASTQKGRRGLGLKLEELEKAHIEFDPEEEIVEAKEEILWLKNEYTNLPTLDEIAEWENEREIGKRKKTIDGETIFCDEIVVKNIINSKSVFDRLDKHEMREARTRSNPFETIRGVFFLNRAAMKMANMDSACDFMFTNPANLLPDELLYFADVCAGPGGFSEYVLWRKKWHAKGFGFTLKNENDFKLHDFHAGPSETFYPYYGPANDGDVYNPENQLALKNLIMSQTDNKGVHFMMADGGFSVEGQENIQEILSKQLYLCQCLVALMIVRTGGHFVTKLFDLFTPFSAGLVYIMYRCFDYVCIFKPNTSRPANSERYLICKGKRGDIDHIANYLFKTNQILFKNDQMHDILELVPVEKLISEEHFYNYLKDSNELLGQKQVIGLKKIAAYTENNNLLETKQKMMREECLKYWKVPDITRKLTRSANPSTRVSEILGKSASILEKGAYKNATKLTKENIANIILLNPCDWYCTPCSAGPDAKLSDENKSTTFYLGMGRSQVYKYDGGWVHVRNIPIELPEDTLVYAEMVSEMKKEGKSMTRTYGLHILDAYTLGSECISEKHFSERQKIIQLFCKALWKPIDSNNSSAPIRMKEWFPVDSHLLGKIVLEQKSMKNGSKVLGYFPRANSHEYDHINEKYYYIPRNIAFFKVTGGSWACHWSNSNKKLYYFNKVNRQSIWEIPSSAALNFVDTIQTRVIWDWTNQVLPTDYFIKCFEHKKVK